MTRDLILNHVQRIYDAWDSHDHSTVLAGIDPSFEWVVPGANRLTGKAVGAEKAAEVLTALDEIGYTVSPRHFVADDDRVIALAQVTIDGTQLGAIDVWTFTDDRLVKYQHASTDTTVLDRALGAK